MIEVLSPGMQDRREPDLGAEVLGIGGDCRERLGRRCEQQTVHRGLVLIGDGADRRRQGEHDVEIRDRQQFGGTRLQPLGRGARLTLRAMPIAARVVRNTRMGAVLAALDMTAERDGTARLDRGHDAKLVGADVSDIGVAPRRTVAAEDLRHLQRRSGQRRRLRPAARLRSSDAQAGSGSAGLC